MSFDAGSIKAKMVLDKTQFSSGLQSGIKEAKAFDAKIGAIFRGGLMVTGIAFAAKQVYNFADNAARVATMADAFERMAGGVANANELLAQARSVTRALSNTELRSAANQLELLGIGMEKLPRFVEIARSAAIGLGQDVGFMLQSLSTGTARQSRLWLDNLGIIISVEQANEEYARTLGKTSRELSDTEQRAAFLNAVLTHGQDIISKVGADSETSAEKVESLGAAFDNLGDAIKRLVTNSGLPTLMSALAMFLSGDIPFSLPFGGGFMSVLPGGNRKQKGPWTSTDVAAPGMDELAQQLLAAMKRDAQFASIQQQFGPVAANGPTMRGTGNTFFGLDWREVTDPGLTMGADRWTQTFNVIGSGLSSLGDAFGSFFEMLVTNSADAGKAFFSGLMNGFAGMASTLGDAFIQIGTATEAIKLLDGWTAIAAGLGLKMLAGVMRGVAFNNAPISAGPARSLRNPLGNGEGAGGAFTLVVNGDFVGDRVWVQRLASMIRQNERNFGSPKVVFNS